VVERAFSEATFPIIVTSLKLKLGVLSKIMKLEFFMHLHNAVPINPLPPIIPLGPRDSLKASFIIGIQVATNLEG
jgi:hypothetical protein